ncbi:MAG TPA: YHYH domain-containing protein [Flavobacterium sp.]|nr:YHYH domain-containing protein [Flavobacterium sp.]
MSVSSAHPGRTDSSGGHTCRTNCPSWGLDYGEYHYHGGYTAPAPTPQTWQFNSKIYYSYSEYLSAKSTYEAEQKRQAEEQRLKEEEQERLVKEQELREIEEERLRQAEQKRQAESAESNKEGVQDENNNDVPPQVLPESDQSSGSGGGSLVALSALLASGYLGRKWYKNRTKGTL